MVAAVARAEEVEKVSSAPVERKRSPRARTKGRVKAKVSLFSMAMLFLIGLALPFAYTNIYANLAKTGYSKSNFEVLRWKQKVDNQRLKVLINRYSGYGRVKAGALKMGMVRASKYDYLGQTQTVASR